MNIKVPVYSADQTFGMNICRVIREVINDFPEREVDDLVVIEHDLTPIDEIILCFGKPSPELAASGLRYCVGPSIAQVMGTPAGLEKLKRALRLWWMRRTDTAEDEIYFYDLVEPNPNYTGSLPGYVSKIRSYAATMPSQFTKLIVDIETSGDIKVDQPEDTELLSVAVNFVKANGKYDIAVWTKDALVDPYCRARLAIVLSSGVPVGGHNLQFDVKWLNNHFKKELGKYKIKPDFDTLIKHYALFPGATGDHGLKGLAQTLCGAPEWEKEQKQWLRGAGHFERIPQYVLYAYNSGDTYWNLRLDEQLDEWIAASPPAQYLLKTVLMPATRMFVDIEDTDAGWPIDIESATTLEARLSKEAAHQLIKLRKAVGDPTPYLSATNAASREKSLALGKPLTRLHEFNPGSPQQVKKWLNDNGAQVAGTDAAILDELLKDKHTPPKVLKFVERLTAYRRTTKMLANYVTGLLETVRDGATRPTFKIYGTITGRLSSSIHTVPRKDRGPFRDLYIAGRGELVIGADYKNLETRCVAELCGDPQMIDDLQLDREDFFDILMVQGFPRHFRRMADVKKMQRDAPVLYKELRTLIKTVSHGINYGRGAGAISKALELPYDETNRIYRGYLDRYPLLRVWQEETMDFVKGERIDPTWGVPGLWTPLGRRFQQGVIWEANENNIRNSALAFRPQSIGSDLMLLAAIDFHNNYAADLQARLTGLVHDAGYLIAPEEHGQEALTTLVSCMDKSARRFFDRVPFPVDGKTGLNWQQVS